MTQDKILEILESSISTIMLVSAPPLIMGLLVGITVSIFQTVTSIQEPTLAFVPKIVAVLLSMLFFGGFMISTLRDYVANLYDALPELIIPK